MQALLCKESSFNRLLCGNILQPAKIIRFLLAKNHQLSFSRCLVEQKPSTNKPFPPQSSSVDLSKFKSAPIVKIESKDNFFSKYDNRVMRRMGKATFSPAVDTRLIKIRYVSHRSQIGKVVRFSALVVAGNKNGGIGYGMAKSFKTVDAIAKAGRIAERNMEFFDLFQGRTLFHPVTVKFKATILLAKPAPASNSPLLFLQNFMP